MTPQLYLLNTFVFMKCEIEAIILTSNLCKIRIIRRPRPRFFSHTSQFNHILRRAEIVSHSDDFSWTIKCPQLKAQLLHLKTVQVSLSLAQTILSKTSSRRKNVNFRQCAEAWRFGAGTQMSQAWRFNSQLSVEETTDLSLLISIFLTV